MCFAIFKYILLTLLGLVIANHKLFLESVAVNLYSLDILARNRPGRSKALYLYSLQDYLERQYEEIQKPLDVASNRDLDKSSSVSRSELCSVIKDMEYLKAKSTSTKDEGISMIQHLTTLPAKFSYQLFDRVVRTARFCDRLFWHEYNRDQWQPMAAFTLCQNCCTLDSKYDDCSTDLQIYSQIFRYSICRRCRGYHNTLATFNSFSRSSILDCPYCAMCAHEF